MLDLRWIVENAELARENQRRRNSSYELIDLVLKKDVERRNVLAKLELLRAARNNLAKEIGEKKRKKENVDELMARSKEVNDNMVQFEQENAEIDTSLNKILLEISNTLDPSVPTGKNEKDNKEIRRHGEPRKFSFTPFDHHDLGVKLGLLDFERSSRMAGARFASLRGKLAKLNRSIIQFMLDLQTQEHGYEEILPPFIVNSKALTGTSQLPKFAADLFKLENADYYLIPTAEVPLTNFYREEILDEDKLPVKLVAYTPCFRSEAGSYGKDTKGLIRQHQFEKIEIVIFSHPEKSQEMHELLVSNAEEVLKRLELPYRTMLLCSGDIGFGAAKCYDIEVWLPGQNTYREISSCSNFKDFQARRAQLKFRPKGGGKVQFLHTLNGSALAVGRTLLAIMENYQHEDGSIAVPKALQKYTGFDSIRAE